MALLQLFPFLVFLQRLQLLSVQLLLQRNLKAELVVQGLQFGKKGKAELGSTS